MAEICCGVVAESEDSCESISSRAARRRRTLLRRVRIEPDPKRPRVELRDCDNALDNCGANGEGKLILSPGNGRELHPAATILLTSMPSVASTLGDDVLPKFGIASVCGRRRDMEDAVAIHPLFGRIDQENAAHYYGVYDGHGCSHVATKCKERLHEMVREELMLNNDVALETSRDDWWKCAMERSFARMDREVVEFNEIESAAAVGGGAGAAATCRCELQTPECDAVGSTAVVAVVTPEKIVVANCGDSRAVLCRGGKAFPLSVDHKPDRPDELSRIQAAGGRVIYWEGARVLGVLAMSRAIGDNYLKPYVSCEPEVTITDRTEEDEFLILASDGLWDVVSNDTACGVARMCLKGTAAAAPPSSLEKEGGESSDKACSDASMLLTKLALARRSADNISVVVIDLRKPT